MSPRNQKLLWINPASAEKITTSAPTLLLLLFTKIFVQEYLIDVSLNIGPPDCDALNC